jgi:hypothetical protein
MILRALIAPILLCPAGSPADAAVLKVTSISDLSQLPTPLPYPFDESANADVQVSPGDCRLDPAMGAVIQKGRNGGEAALLVLQHDVLWQVRDPLLDRAFTSQ